MPHLPNKSLIFGPQTLKTGILSSSLKFLIIMQLQKFAAPLLFPLIVMMSSLGNLLPRVFALPKKPLGFSTLNCRFNAPNRGSRSIGQRSLDILTRVWAHKLLPPNIKTFVWRLVRKAIATGVRAGNLSDKISKNCANCNLPENDSHLFFHCNFARAVWFSSKTPLRSSLLPFEQDGVQEALSTVVTTNTTDADLQRLMTTLWYIWIARNDLRFKNKQWSVLQVQYAVDADISVVMQQNDKAQSIFNASALQMNLSSNAGAQESKL